MTIILDLTQTLKLNNFAAGETTQGKLGMEFRNTVIWYKYQLWEDSSVRIVTEQQYLVQTKMMCSKHCNACNDGILCDFWDFRRGGGLVNPNIR